MKCTPLHSSLKFDATILLNLMDTLSYPYEKKSNEKYRYQAIVETTYINLILTFQCLNITFSQNNNRSIVMK